jgi:dolichol-phosphate mannosyltransferase
MIENIVSSVEIKHENQEELIPLTVSIIVPTRNESGNVRKLLTSIRNAFYGTSLEVIFIDDSTDDTPEVVKASVEEYPFQHVRLIHRLPEERTGGLGGAVVAGLKAARADYACVMDGDLQHPPEVVPVLLKTAIERQADLVVATRRSDKSQVTGLSTARNLISKGLDLVARMFFPRQLHGVSDPLTGFFLVKVKALNLDALHPQGFKILMEILVRNPRLVKAEVPFHFGERFSGESKASASEAFKYLHLLWNMRFGESSLRFIGFAVIGASGIFVNSAALYLATEKLHFYYLISAAVATVASTLWNFGLTESLVYRTKNQGKGILRRLGLFFVMNLLVLALRAPIIYLLTSILGLYYVASNLISMVVLTVLRFMTADNLIWGQKQSNKKNNSKLLTGRLSMKKAFNYDIHGILTVSSESVLPELEPFRVSNNIDDPTICVQTGNPRKAEPGEENGHYMRYREILGHMGFEVGIEMGETVSVTATKMLSLSPHVLYTNVIEPILRWTFVKKGYALVHGATIAFGNAAYMITARTDTGKTTTLLKILAYQRRERDHAAFLSDDMTIVSPDGRALTYPKPLTISYHTLRAVNSDTLTFKERLALPFQSRIHSRSGRKFAQLIGKTHMPAATINLFTQMIVPPPKYSVSKLVPGVKLTEKANLTGMFIIERGEEAILPIKNSEAMEVLLQNCEDAYGFPPYESIKEFLYCVYGFDLHEKEQAIIQEALGRLPATVIRSSNLDWWSQIPSFVNNEQVSVDISRALEVETFARNHYTKQPEHINAR